MRLASFNFLASYAEDNPLAEAGVALAAGRERRRAVADRLQLINGPEWVGSLGARTANESFSGLLGVGFNYVPGLQCLIGGHFYVGVETLPGVQVSYSLGR